MNDSPETGVVESGEIATKAQRDLSGGEDPDNESELAEGARKISTQWACTADQTLYWASTPTAEKLLPGLYKCIHTNETGHSLRRLIVSTDALISFDDDAATSKVRNEITKFWKLGDKYKAMGILHKRGILMYGDPGSGKTSVIQQLIKALITAGGIAIYADDPNLLTGSLQVMRRIEPHRPCIVVLEDFETLTERSQRENEWLSVLDGEAQINNVVFLATTNYVEKLDKRFTDRPSRFDTIMMVPMPGARVRAVYLLSKLPDMDDDSIADLVFKTQGMSIAHLKEVVVSAFCLNDGANMSPSDRRVLIDEVLAKLKKMQDRKFNSEDVKAETSGGLGFIKHEVADDSGAGLDWVALREYAKKYQVGPSDPTSSA